MHNPDLSYATKPDDLTTHLSPTGTVIHPMAERSPADVAALPGWSTTNGTSVTFVGEGGQVTSMAPDLVWVDDPERPTKRRHYLRQRATPQHGEERRKLKAARKRGRKGRNR